MNHPNRIIINNINRKRNYAEFIINGGNGMPPIPPLVRSTHKLCQNNLCHSNVSNYTHNFCFVCCYLDQNSKEYKYHYT